MLYYMNKSPHCRGKQRMIAFHNLSEGGDEHDRSCQNAVAPVGGGDRVAALERLWRVRLCDDQAQESRIYGGVHARAAELFLQLPAMGECRLGARRVGIGARLGADRKSTRLNSSH